MSRPLASLLLLLALALPACGYSPQELYPEQYRSVAVPIFENRTQWPRVQFDVSEALVKEIEQRTPYKVTAVGAADTVLEGTIRSLEQRQLSRRRPGGVPEELEITMVVDFEWRDLRTGETLRDRRGFEVVGRYAPARPVSQPFETAQHEVAQQLARDIVSTLRADW